MDTTTSTAVTRSSGEIPLTEIQHSMLRLFRDSQEHDPARSAALITAEMFEVFPSAGNPALEVVSTVVVASMAVVVGVGKRVNSCTGVVENPRVKGANMLRNISIVDHFEWKKCIRFAVFVLLAISLGASFVPMYAQDSGQQTFTSVVDAASAFFTAMQAPDDHPILKILGPAGNDIVSSGDPIEDFDARTNFTLKYQEMHRFATEPNGTVTLIVGAENWPLPIPLVKKNGAWYFDTKAGKDEILFRRIGENELLAIQACSDLVDAQKQYYDRAPNGFADQYAQKLVSDDGKYNGLYWEGTDDQYNSPIDPRIANASGKSSKDQVGHPVPFNGYFFRILASQGRHAPGGDRKYVVNGKMTTGFAFVAYPAEYRSSGVMSFVVSKSGVVYEKDFGPNTTQLAEAMTAYDPDSTWNKEELASQAGRQ
jgi:Protein of unknown function (DUF2950)